MADMKSMLPDLKDVTNIATKLFKDMKKSVTEIVSDYKEKHCREEKATHAKHSGAKHHKAEEKVHASHSTSHKKAEEDNDK